MILENVSFNNEHTLSIFAILPVCNQPLCSEIMGDFFDEASPKNLQKLHITTRNFRPCLCLIAMTCTCFSTLNPLGGINRSFPRQHNIIPDYLVLPGGLNMFRMCWTQWGSAESAGNLGHCFEPVVITPRKGFLETMPDNFSSTKWPISVAQVRYIRACRL